MGIALVGEAWGAEEEKVGKPFVGRAGEQLDKFLRASGIERSECFVTNIFNERPPENDFGVYYEDKARRKPTLKLQEAWATLEQELTKRGVNLVIALGNEPLRALTRKLGIETWRGSILASTLHGIKVIPTFHPAAILRVGPKNAWYIPAVLHDFSTAKSEEGAPFPEMPKVETTTSPEVLMEFLTQAEGGRVSVDIETTFRYVGEQLSCIGFSSKEGEALVVPLIKEIETEVPGKKKSYWSWEPTMTDPSEIAWLVSNFFASEKWLKVGQNLQFDIGVLKRAGWVDRVDGIYMDTLVAHANAVDPELPHDLGFLASWYTRYPYFKHMVDSVNEGLWLYNGYDCAATFEVMLGIERDMERLGTEEFYHAYINNLVLPTALMGARGLAVDQEYREFFRRRVKEDIEAKLEVFNSLTGGGIENHRSNPQIAAHFYQTKGYDPVLNKVGKPTVDELALKRIARRTGDKAVEVLLELRGLDKVLSSYINNLPSDGPVRTTYLYAKTGRFRSGGNDE